MPLWRAEGPRRTRRRAPGPLLLCFLAAFSLPACAKGGSARERSREDHREILRRALREQEARIEAVKAETAPLLMRLRELSSGYWGKDAQERFQAREGLRAEILAKREAFSRLRDEYNILMKRHEVLYFSAAQEVLSGSATDFPAVVGDGVMYYSGFRYYFRGLNNYGDNVERALAADKQSYQTALNARKSRRFWMLAGALAALLLGALYLAVRWLELPARIVVEGAEPVRMLGDSYRLGEEYHRDSQGVAYLATYLQEKSPCAVWVLRKEGGLAPSAVTSAAQRASRVRAPGIENVLAVLSEEERVCLVLDPPRGESLERLLAGGGRLPWGRAAALIGKAAEVIDRLHAAGGVHGGLRLADFHVGSGEEVSIGGFGVPRVEEPASSAPEQMFGPALPASDLYALAVCAYRAATGLFPFPGPDFPDQKRREAFVPPSQTSAGVPRGVDEAFRRALLPDPSGRQSSCAEFAMALTAAWVRSRRKG